MYTLPENCVKVNEMEFEHAMSHPLFVPMTITLEIANVKYSLVRLVNSKLTIFNRHVSRDGVFIIRNH